jgi:predicted lipoprotein with Yx(FWY)xxD motif
MTPGARLVVPLAGLSGALAACGSGAVSPDTRLAARSHADASSAASTLSVSPTNPQPRPIVIRTANSRYGRVLVDARGRTLYLFTHDKSATSTCVGACARAWPPYLAAGRGRASGGAHGSLVGVTVRANGSRQVAYNRHPLYYYVGDRSPGDILCQDVEEYGGHWWVVSPVGAAITTSGPPCGPPR